MTIGLNSIDQLADVLEVDARGLASIARSADKHYEEMVLLNPARPGKERVVVRVKEPLRRIQERIFHKLLKPSFAPSPYSHGGMPGRSIKTNALPHLNSIFYLTTDIADFFPSIRMNRVDRLFQKDLRFSPSVASYCAKLCTRKNRLTQGSVTSLILADRLMAGADRRIGAMCDRLSRASRSPVIYTRYVDDLTISSRFPLDSGSTPRIVLEILESCGFRVNAEKQDKGRLSDGGLITRLRIHKGRLDIDPLYLASISSLLRDAATLAEGGSIGGDYLMPSQIFGRIQFVGWINPGRLPGLMQAYHSIDWGKAEAVAAERNLIRPMKQIIKTFSSRKV